jgi:hypothetical protein
MRIQVLKFLRHGLAYLLGAFLIGWGLWCFGVELLYPAETARESVAANNALVLYAPTMFAAVIICWGTILALTPRFDVVSGALIFLGSFVAGCAMIGLAYHLGDVAGQIPLSSVLPAIATLTFILALGICSLTAGFILFRRKHRAA